MSFKSFLRGQSSQLSIKPNLVRLGFLLLFLILGWWILVMRLVDIQLVRGEEFKQRADDNRYFTLRIPPERGVFFDRYSQALTWNQRRYYKVKDPTAIHAELEALSREEALSLMATQSAYVRYSWEREYTQPLAMSHVLGYVGPVTAEDLLADGSLTVSDQVGKSGLELVFDQRLQGKAGYKVYEINALGQRQRLVEEKLGQEGVSFKTSLDPFLSAAAHHSLTEEIGAVVIMGAENGQVLSSVSQPSFDLNLFSQETTNPELEKQRQQTLRELLNDERKVFFNRAISGAYPPGSIFKLVTAISGLETEKIDAGTTVLDEGVLRVGEYEYRNWYYTQYGRTEGEISLVRALARSNDIYFYKVAEWVGPNQLADFARLLGLGTKTGIELQGEVDGLIPDPSWKEQTLGEPWYLGNTFHMGIGQGNILTSPLQLAQLTQAVANQGELCSARLLNTDQTPSSNSNKINDQEQNCAHLSLDPENIELVLQGMLGTCSPGGTAYPFFDHNQQSLAQFSNPESVASEQLLEAGAVACKTGTAEFGAQDERGHRPTHAWLTAIVDTTQIKKLAEEAELLPEKEDQLSEGDSELTALETEVSSSIQDQHKQWLKAIREHQLPDKLVIAVLVESDEEEPYKEGSEHAGVVAKNIVDWMYGRLD